MKKETWQSMFGHEPNKEMKTMVMEEVAATGADIREVIAKYTLPTMAIMGPDGKFDDMVSGRRLTTEEWREINPLGEYGKLVIVSL
ncbi:MAG: hypothetical protein IPI37_02840 [Bacteroidales bacterium]|jgi:hypothetical protein|nr:hypothetical protein [Bacteroidales bacterium]HQO43923.1 hypothetical protein [Bacillota bacterium]